MIRVNYERNYSDNRSQSYEAKFDSLAQFEDWFFGRCINAPYDKGIFLPDPDNKRGVWRDGPSSLDIYPIATEDGCDLEIHMIRDGGIIFSDGRFTNRQKHWNDTAKDMCRRMRARQANPTFDFV